MKGHAYLLVVIFSIVSTPTGTTAAIAGGEKFEPICVEENQVLTLRGAGIFRYMYFIKAYAGALYLPEIASSDKALADVPKRLEIAHFHAIDGEDFGLATISGILKNVDEATFKRIEPGIRLHNSLYVDAQPEDRYALTYLPGRGTTISLNGKALGLIPGAEFASALFAIWVGEVPLSRDFKGDILGKG